MRELGETFAQPSAALGGHALCATSTEEIAHLTALAAEIDAAKSCSDRQLAALSAGAGPFSAIAP